MARAATGGCMTTAGACEATTCRASRAGWAATQVIDDWVAVPRGPRPLRPNSRAQKAELARLHAAAGYDLRASNANRSYDGMSDDDVGAASWAGGELRQTAALMMRRARHAPAMAPQ
jgi:hypothetical protein